MTISVEEREISATSMAIAPERMPKIKKEIRNFRKKIMDLAAQDPEPELLVDENGYQSHDDEVSDCVSERRRETCKLAVW